LELIRLRAGRGQPGVGHDTKAQRFDQRQLLLTGLKIPDSFGLSGLVFLP